MHSPFATSVAVSCRQEGDEIVVRIPVELDRPVIVAVTGAGGVAGGWAVVQGSTREIPPAVRQLLSAAPLAVDRECVDLLRAEADAVAKVQIGPLDT